MYLVLVDTTAIQTYIFGSNRLQENIGASFLVDQATGTWAMDIFNQMPVGKTLLYAGGGNFTALFDSPTQANSFKNRLTRKVLTDAPGLQILVASVPRSAGKLSDDLNAAFEKMAQVKAERARSAPTLGLGVTRPCASTGLPASYSLKINDADLSLSPEIFAKVHGFNTPLRKDGKPKQIRDLAYERLTKALKPAELAEWQKRDYKFPRDFEEMGRSKNEQSYIAVVHADGNGMGDRIKQIGKAETTPEQYRKALSDFSDSVKNASERALRNTLADLVNSITPAKTDPVTGKITPPFIAHPTLEMTVPLQPSKDRKSWMLPFRPIVFGGDDVTFVCDGRLGIALAVAFLNHFEAETASLPDGKGRATACAGVAIVKSRYPFARTYDTAKELCDSAKAYRKTLLTTPPTWDESCLDWYFALGGLSGDLDTIRKREFIVPGYGNLEQRPVALRQVPDPLEHYRTWRFVADQVQILQSDKWATKRNKMKTLRETLRGGPNEVKKFRTLFRQDLTPLLPPDAPDAWTGGRCVLFDAIELTDIHMPLKSQTVSAAASSSSVASSQEKAQ